VDCYELKGRLAKYAQNGVGVIERVSARPDKGDANRLPQLVQLIRAAGKIEGLVETMGMSRRMVTPAQWKRHFNLLKTEKHASCGPAKQLYPQYEKQFCKTRHDRADATLIARFLWEKEFRNE
jgi:crossover junction endodeoxyribonuclease RuvC